MSQQKIDALNCHLKLEVSLQRKHYILQIKLAQLNQLRSITDELIHLNALIKRDMSNGESYIDYLRQLKEEKQQTICDWKKINKQKLTNTLFSNRKKYSTIMKQTQFCSIDDNHLFVINNNIRDIYDCRPRDNTIPINEDMSFNDKQLQNKKQNLMACKFSDFNKIC
jgi:hypothetical protein